MKNIILFHPIELDLFSSKKGVSSSKNGRDSSGKRLGAKKSDGQYVHAGDIIYRQRGTKLHPGENVGMGRDHTLFALINGYVKYKQRSRATRHICVTPER